MEGEAMPKRFPVLLLWLMAGIGVAFADSSRATYVQVVNQAKPSLWVTATPSSAVVNSTVVTIAVNVASSAGTPADTVTLTDGAATIGVLTLSEGLATTTQVFSTVGTHDLSFCYSGDHNSSSACTSDGNGNATVSVVPPPDFSIRALPTSGTINAGQSWTTNLVIDSLNGFAAPVTLSCSSLPVEMGCKFSPGVVQVVSGDPGSTLTISSAPATHAAFWMPLSTLGALGVVLPLRRRRRRGHWLLMLGVLAVAIGFLGCGTGLRYVQTDGLTKQTYNVVITGTSGNLRHSTAVNVTVQAQSQTLSVH